MTISCLTKSDDFDTVDGTLTRLFFYTYNMNETVLNIVQIVLGVILVTVVLLQNKGTGLGGAFGGGGGGEGNVYRTKRGFEKALFRSTIVVSILFLGTALVNVLIRQ